MLLTSTQVSLAVSSLVVSIFTMALFLSGYFLQQQTLRDLRAAIKPQLLRTVPGPGQYLVTPFRDGGRGRVGGYWDTRGVVDAVLGEIIDEKIPSDQKGRDVETNDNMIGATRWQKERLRKMRREQKEAETQRRLLSTDDDTNPLDHARTEKASEMKTKLLNPAERRKLIKAQILDKGEGESAQGYRRRMW